MATVIKATTPQALEGGSFNFEDIADRAKEYLESVRKQAAEILNQAEREAAAIRHQAEEQGLAAALKTAEQTCEVKLGQQLSTLLPAVREATDRIQEAKAEWLLHWEKMAVHVAAAIAQRVIRRELARSPEITISLVKEALELAAGNGDFQLRMHPSDAKALGDQVQLLIAELSSLGKARVVADPQITPGGCRIETKFGVIDQQFETQLARIEAELTY